MSTARIATNRRQKAQYNIVADILLANESHRINLRTGIAVVAKESDVLGPGRCRSLSRRVFVTSHLSLPLSGTTFVAASVINKGITAAQLTFVQYQHATN